MSSPQSGAGDQRSWRGLAPGMRRVLRFLGPPEERWEVLMVMAVLVGLVSGVSAVGLRSAVHHLFLTLAPLREGLAACLLPAGGALLSVVIVAILFREPPGHGVPQVIRAVCRGGGVMRRRGAFSLWLGSLINVSSGGSAGLESPIVYSGAAIGSWLGGLFRFDERRRSVLLACGVAGGISAIFNAPITGMIFAMEVVLVEWSAFSIVPIIVCAVSATEVSRVILQKSPTFEPEVFTMGHWDLASCILLGVLAGGASVGLSKMLDLSHSLAGRLPRGRFVAPLLFGLVVGMVGLLAPEAIGEGYDTVQDFIGPGFHDGLLLCVGLAVAKLIATAATLGSGAPGGVFAPCLVLGSLSGAIFFRAATSLGLAGGLEGNESSYALVGMAGLVSGVMQAPLTGIFLVMEATGGYEAILPLMIVSVLSLLVARRFDRYGIYTKELAAAGDLLRPGTDRRILSEISLREALDEEVTIISEDFTLSQVIAVTRSTRRNHFPVVNRETEEFVGLLDLHSVRELLFDPDVARVTLVGTVMDIDPPTVEIDATLTEAVRAFEEHDVWVLPVLEGSRFAGLVSKSTLFDHYRHELSVQAT
jgi:chloride channel protein, CIC family